MNKILRFSLIAVFLGLLSSCYSPPPGPQPRPPVVNPNPPPTPVVQQGAVFVPPYGPDSVPVPESVLTTYKEFSDKFAKVYGDLKKPLFAKSQPDGGVALLYNIIGSKQRVYFVFRGSDGALTRISQN